MPRLDVFPVRFLLLALPQFAGSAIAIFTFDEVFQLPSETVPLHLTTIAGFQLLFFAGCGWVFARNEDVGAWSRGTLALLIFSKFWFINGVYLASFTTYKLWGAYLSWGNLSAAGSHLRGFRDVFGWVVWAALILLGGLLVLHFAMIWRASPRLLRFLRWSLPDCASRRAALVLAVLASGVASTGWTVLPLMSKSLAVDPLLSFWTNSNRSRGLLSDAVLADISTKQSYQVPASFRRRNVVVVTIDCLRADHLAINGYHRDTMPFVSELASAGRLQQVDLAIANGNDSPTGILSVLGSRHPEQQRIHNFKLSDLLKKAGYRIHLMAAGDHTTLGDMRRQYGESFDVFADGLSHRNYNVNDDRGVIESLEALPVFDGTPAFFFIHLMSPHSLGVKESRFAHWQPARLELHWASLMRGTIEPTEMTNTYDNGLLQADAYLRAAMAILERKGYLNDHLVVITGDHGEGLGERGNFGHAQNLYMEDISIPLMFLDSDNVDYGPMPFGSQVDIAPTIATRLGLPVPANWEGQNLWRAAPPAVAFASACRPGEWRTLVVRSDNQLLKYMFYGESSEDFRERLFDLHVDPGEKTDLSATASMETLDRVRAIASRHFNLRLPFPL